MNFNVNYKGIKDSVVYSFKEYVEEDGFTASQSAAKIFEEDWRQLNKNSFTQTAYYICVAIESFKLKEIPDFIYEKLDYYFNSNELKSDEHNEEVNLVGRDIHECRQLMESQDYKVTKSSFSATSRIEYILSLRSHNYE